MSEVEATAKPTKPAKPKAESESADEMAGLPVAMRAGASPSGPPKAGDGDVRVPLHTWEGAYVADTAMDGYVFFVDSPPVLRWVDRYFAWHPHSSQYREVDCMDIDAVEASEPVAAPVVQTAVAPVNAETKVR